MAGLFGRDCRIHSFSGAAALSAALLCASATDAGVIPPLEMSVQVSDSGGVIYSDVFNPAGNDLGGGLYQYGGTFADTPEFDVTSVAAGILVRPDLSNPLGALLGPNLQFINETSGTLTFDITLTLPFNSASSELQWNSDSSWTLGGPGTPSLVTAPDTPLWTVLSDGGTIGTQFDDPSGLSGGGSLGTDPISGLLGPVSDSIGIRLVFELSGGATAGVNGFFTIVPAPGAIALFGFAGLAGRRRRRH